MHIRNSTIHLVLFGLWLTIGAILSYMWRDVLLWVGFMSLYAILLEHLVGWAAERAKELHKEKD